MSNQYYDREEQMGDIPEGVVLAGLLMLLLVALVAIGGSVWLIAYLIRVVLL